MAGPSASASRPAVPLGGRFDDVARRAPSFPGPCALRPAPCVPRLRERGSQKTSADGESFSDLPTSCLCTGRTGRQNREEPPMMVTSLVVIGALLVGACSWHLMRRYKSRS